MWLARRHRNGRLVVGRALGAFVWVMRTATAPDAYLKGRRSVAISGEGGRGGLTPEPEWGVEEA